MSAARRWTTSLLGVAALGLTTACSSVVIDPDAAGGTTGLGEGGEASELPGEPSVDYCTSFASPPTGAEICETFYALGSNRTCSFEALYAAAPPECEDEANQHACCLSTMLAEHGLELTADCVPAGEAFRDCATGE